jgi:hypothetical protein
MLLASKAIDEGRVKRSGRFSVVRERRLEGGPDKVTPRSREELRDFIGNSGLEAARIITRMSGQPPNYLYFARMKSMLSPTPYPNFSLIPRTRSSLATKASRRLAGNLFATTRACSNMRTSAAK